MCKDRINKLLVRNCRCSSIQLAGIFAYENINRLAYSSEKYPTFYKAKGFNERLLVINCSPGNPQYDISEILNDSGDPKYRKLHNELVDLRKLLLMFRILNHDKAIPDIQISLRNREKQLCKPILRLFQEASCLNEISRALSKFLLEKKNKKLIR